MGKIFVISGPSAAGKTVIVNEAIKRLHNITRMVTYTSRLPRNDEEHGKDYMFIPRGKFEKKVQEGFFLESVDFGGNLYGSPRPPEDGNSVVYVVEMVGAKNLKKLLPEACFIWIEPPDMETLKIRLKKRGVESEAEFNRRVEQSELDMKEAHKIRLFDYVLVNDNFEQAVNEFILLIKKALE